MKSLFNGLRMSLSSRSIFSSPLPLWQRVNWTSRRWLRHIGWPGVLAIGILAMCPAFYFSAILPEQTRLDAARHSADRLHEQFVLASVSPNGPALSPEDQLAEFYHRFPVEGCSPQWLEKLVALAANRGLSLNDGEYKAMHDKVGKLVRYQMTLPVKGEYPQIRKFLTDLPGALPAVALENVQFERQKIADTNVEAKIRLVLYMERAS